MESLIWSVTHLVAGLVLPPGIFFVSIAIGLSQGSKRRWARWLTVGSLVAFVLASLQAVAYLLARPFETAWPPLDPARIQSLPRKEAMIVVLGGGRTLGALEYPERETLSSASLKRSRYGVKLAKDTGLPLGVSAGKPGGGEISEAALMKHFIETELNHTVAIVEDRSLDTWQNAQFTTEKLRPLNIHTVVLVTDVMHMPRAARAFESVGLKVVPAPMDFQATAPLIFTDFLPSAEGLRLSQYVFRELLGEVWYRWRRAIGGILPIQAGKPDSLAAR